MYLPKHFTVTDKDKILAFMRQYSFAAVITAKGNVPVANHLPIVVEEKNDIIVLSGHFAKSNTQWQGIESSQTLVVFTEPHAYVSPRHYDKEQNVPTWNYISIHAYGSAKLVTDEKQSYALLEKMMDAYEPEYRKQWSTLPQEYKTRLLQGIVPFEMVITEIQAKEKLSQNRSETEKQRIIGAFEASEKENEQAIARFMKNT